MTKDRDGGVHHQAAHPPDQLWTAPVVAAVSGSEDEPEANEEESRADHQESKNPRTHMVIVRLGLAFRNVTRGMALARRSFVPWGRVAWASVPEWPVSLRPARCPGWRSVSCLRDWRWPTMRPPTTGMCVCWGERPTCSRTTRSACGGWPRPAPSTSSRIGSWPGTALWPWH